MKFLSIAGNNLCSTWNDSFQTANNSSSHIAVTVGAEVWLAKGSGGEVGGRVQPIFRATAIYWCLDFRIKRHKWPHGFDCFDGCVRFHLASPSRCGDQWLLRSHEGQSNALISRMIHIPSELEKIEACMWGIIINTRAVSPSHETGRTLHNYMANRSAERWPGRPWPRY